MATLDGSNCNQSINLNDDENDFFSQDNNSQQVPESSPVVTQNGLKPQRSFSDGENDDEDDFFSELGGNQATRPNPSLLINDSAKTTQSLTKPTATLDVTANTASSTTATIQNFCLSTGDDQPNDIHIEVAEPRRIGDNVIDSHICYKVRTVLTKKTATAQIFKDISESTVDRRFSDFLGLYEKLKMKHQYKGILVPPTPDKDVKALAKIKFATSDQEATDLNAIERRRAGLERFLNRIACHHILLKDDLFIEFLINPQVNSSQSSTRTISWSGVKKFIKSAEDQVTKLTRNYAEQDAWFDEKQSSVDRVLFQYQQLYQISLQLYRSRRELGDNFKGLSQELSGLVHLEQNHDKSGYMTDLCSQLGQTYASVSQRTNNQQRVDCFDLTEIVGDHIRMLESVKELLHVRVKAFLGCQKLEEDLYAKKQTRQRCEGEAKFDKLPKLDFEIGEYEKNLQKSQEHFKTLSQVVKEEISVYEIKRAVKMQNTIKSYLEEIAQYHSRLADVWSVYLPKKV